RSEDAGRHFRATRGIVIGEDGLFGQDVAVLPATNDRTLLASTSAGLFRSTDGGRAWSLVRAVADPQAIATNPRNPQVVLVATLFGGIQRSVDGGRTFAPVPGTPTVRFVSGDREVSGRFLAGGAAGALESLDGGRTFHADN